MTPKSLIHLQLFHCILCIFKNVLSNAMKLSEMIALSIAFCDTALYHISHNDITTNWYISTGNFKRWVEHQKALNFDPHALLWNVVKCQPWNDVDLTQAVWKNIWLSVIYTDQHHLEPNIFSYDAASQSISTWYATSLWHQS